MKRSLMAKDSTQMAKDPRKKAFKKAPRYKIRSRAISRECFSSFKKYSREKSRKTRRPINKNIWFSFFKKSNKNSVIKMIMRRAGEKRNVDARQMRPLWRDFSYNDRTNLNSSRRCVNPAWLEELIEFYGMSAVSQRVIHLKH